MKPGDTKSTQQNGGGGSGQDTNQYAQFDQTPLIPEGPSVAHKPRLFGTVLVIDNVFPLLAANLLVIPNVKVRQPETEEQHGVQELSDALPENGAATVDGEVTGAEVVADVEGGQSV